MRARAVVGLAVIGLCGCRQLLGIDDVGDSDPTDAPQPIDAPHDAMADAVPDADPFAPFGNPALNMELSSTADDSDPSLAGDLLEIYFSSSRPGGLGGRDIWRSTRAGVADPWPPPVAVTELNSVSEEANAELSADGLVIYISSSRDGDLDTYVSTRPTRSDTWSVPMIVAALNTAMVEYIGNLDGALGRIVLGSNRTGGAGGFDIYESVGGGTTWSAPAPPAGINTASDDFGPHQSPDGLALYFSSTRTGGAGGRDLYVTVRPTTTDPFAPPTRMVEVCSTLDDDDPWVSPDGHYIIFAADPTASGTRDLYEATR
jgi:hypothetical protein